MPPYNDHQPPLYLDLQAFK